MNNINILLLVILGLILFGSLIISFLNGQQDTNHKQISTHSLPLPHDKTESKYATLEGFEDLKISTPTSEETDRLLVKKK